MGKRVAAVDRKNWFLSKGLFICAWLTRLTEPPAYLLISLAETIQFTRRAGQPGYPGYNLSEAGPGYGRDEISLNKQLKQGWAG